MVKFFPHQKEAEFCYIYPYQIYVDSPHEDIEEALEWCAENMTADWAYIWVAEHVNMRPQESDDIPYKELKDREREIGPARSWLAHGSYRPYCRITFSSPDDASLFKLRFFENE